VIVVDASAVLEFLLQTPIGVRVEDRLFRDEDELHAPHLVDVEVVQGLRRLVRMGEVSSGRADGAIADLTDLDLHRHPHVDLLDRAWKLRDNIARMTPCTSPSQRLSTLRWSPATAHSPRALDTPFGSKRSADGIPSVMT
jgi:predicted nucleic acid-binding protein